MPPRDRIVELESLRGIAALLVVVFHLPKWNPLLDTGIITNSYLMVDLFFVLSGFVIFRAYADKIGSVGDLLRFQFLRFGRLYPIHLTFLLIFLAIEIAKYIAATWFGISRPNTTPFETNNLWAFIEQLFLVSSVLPNRPLTFNYPAWSIGVEFYTYLIFALTVFAVKDFRTVTFAILAIAAVSLQAADLALGFQPMLSCVGGFFTGCLCATASRKMANPFPSYFATAALLVFFFIIHIKPYKEFDFLIGVLSAALIFSLTNAKPSHAQAVLNLPLFVWLGEISYSVYMSHAAVIWTVSQTIRLTLRRPEATVPDGRSYPQLSELECAIVAVIVVATVIALSWFTYTYIERPMREKSRRAASQISTSRPIDNLPEK